MPRAEVGFSLTDSEGRGGIVDGIHTDIKIMTSIPYFLFSIQAQEYITISFWCLPQRLRQNVREISFWRPLKFGFQTDATFRLYFTMIALYSHSHQNAARLLRKNALPTHLNGNVSRSPELFFFFTCCCITSVFGIQFIRLEAEEDRLSSSASPNRLFSSRPSWLSTFFCAILWKLLIHIPQKSWFTGLAKKANWINTFT